MSKGDNNDLFDFMIEGGDDLLNTEECPHCGQVIYLDSNIEWVNKEKKICICPHCEAETVIR